MKNSLLLIGLCIILLAVPVLAEQPWDGNNNATTKYILNITTTHSAINENYTFKMNVNGSDLNLDATCSDLFIVYQDIIEVDRYIEGDCTSAQKDGLNVSWKMRASGTINANTSDEDWSIWTDPLSGEVPSDNEFLVYTFFDDFNALTINDSKWDCDGPCYDTIVSTQPGRAMCAKDSNWGDTMRTAPNFDGDWEIKVDVNITDAGGNTAGWGWCPSSSVGSLGDSCASAGDNFRKLGSYSPSSDLDMRKGGIKFESSPSFPNGTFFNSTLRKLYYGSQNGTWQWGGVFGGATKYNNNSAMTDSKFFCGQADGQAHAIQLDYVAIYGVVPFNPSITIGGAGIGRTLYQLSPPDNSLQNGINTNFSCSGGIGSIAGVNITNITFRIYNPSDVLDNYTIFDVSAQETNDTIVSFVYNATIDGVWKYACDMTDTTNFIVSETNDTFTVDSGVPEITLIAPIIDGNTSIVISTYITTDATAISCYWSVDASSNTSIACTPDGVETTTILDMSALIGYGGHNFIFYANDSLANNNSESLGFVVVERLDEQWMGTGLETEVQHFNITIDDTEGVIDAAILEYDNVEYAGGIVETSGTQKTFGTSFSQPAVGSGTETRYFNWTISGTYLGNAGSTTYPTNSNVIGNIEIVPTTDGSTCDSASATIYTLNFTFRNESDNALVDNPTLTTFYQVWSTDPSNKLNFTWVEQHAGESSYPVCIFPNYAELNADIKLIYGNETEYAYREFNLQNHLLNNETQNYTLYMVDSGETTTITITVQDDVGRKLEEYLVKAILYDYGNATTLTQEVESGITDPDGIVTMELDATQYYAFDVWKDGTLVHTRPPALITQSEFTIIVTTQVLFDPTIYDELVAGIATSLAYNNVTGNITTTWNDPNSLGDSYCLNIYNQSSGANAAFNSQCDTANTGQLIYDLGNITETSGKWLLRLDIRAVENQYYYTIEEEWIDNNKNWVTFGKEGLLWAGIIATTSLALLGAPAPAAVIAGTTITIVVLGQVVEFFSFNWGTMIIFLIIGGAFIFFMRD